MLRTFKNFPTALGFAQNTLGGAYGKVIKVNRLDDPTLDTATVDSFEAVGAGSLRWAITRTYRRMVIETVSGYYQLNSDISQSIDNGNITYLGMLAPGMGTCVKDYQFGNIRGSNSVFRYFKARLGDSQLPTSRDAGNFVSASVFLDDLIIDHCTFSWGLDENLSGYGFRNVTIQKTIISECLSVISSLGSLIGGENVSMHFNLYIHNNSRNPQFTNIGLSNGVIDFRYNIVYNHSTPPISTTGTKINHVKNLIIRGDHTNRDGSTARARNHFMWLGFTDIETNGYQENYLEGNKIEGTTIGDSDQWDGVAWSSSGGDSLNKLDARRLTPHPTLANSFPDLAISEIEALIVADVGNSISRDDVDQRIINELENRSWSKGTLGIIDSQTQAEGYVTLSSTPIRLTGSESHLIPSAIITEFGLDPDTYDYMVDGDPSEAPWKYIFFESNVATNYPVTAPVGWENIVHHNIYEVIGMKTTGEYSLLVDNPVPPEGGIRFCRIDEPIV